MPRKAPSLTSQLYRAARLSNDLRAASRGPVSYSKRVVRRRVYSAANRQTGQTLRRLGL